jgi:hypothetical protein
MAVGNRRQVQRAGRPCRARWVSHGARFKDGVTFTGATGNVGPFSVLGGKYLFFATAAGTSNALQTLMPDGSTFQSVGASTNLTTSAGTAVVDLPAGTFRFTIVTVSAVQGGLVRIPYRAA